MFRFSVLRLEIVWFLARATNARNMLEVGTATGCSGSGLRISSENSGKLTTVEMEPDRKKIAESAFAKAGVEKNVELILGDAEKVIPEIANSRPGEFDLVFMDVGEKKLYAKTLDSCLKALKKGGLFIADDTLYRGVAIKSQKHVKAKTMRKFNKIMFADRNRTLDHSTGRRRYCCTQDFGLGRGLFVFIA